MSAGYVTTNGIRLHCVDEGDGPLVLLCHGFPETWFSWRRQIGPLRAGGFRAVAVDMPGYGLSDKPDVAYDVPWLAACLAGVIHACGRSKAVLAGHDWGGLVAWPFARLYPELTAGIIGLNTPDLPRTPVRPTEFLRMRGRSSTAYILAFQDRGGAEAAIEADVEAFLRLLFCGPATVNKEVFTDEVLEVYAKAFRPKGAITPPLEYYRNLDRNWELAAAHDGVTIDVPCLMICAENDPVLRPELSEGMEARVPNLRRTLIAECGHWTQQERPDETTGAMLEYLRSLDPW